MSYYVWKKWWSWKLPLLVPVTWVSKTPHLCSHRYAFWTHPSRVVKDSTPSQCRILRCINFRICEYSLYLFLHMVNLHCILESWPRKNINFVNLHPTVFLWWGIFTYQIVLEKKWINGESWSRILMRGWNRGETSGWVKDASWWLY